MNIILIIFKLLLAIIFLLINFLVLNNINKYKIKKFNYKIFTLIILFMFTGYFLIIFPVYEIIDNYNKKYEFLTAGKIQKVSINTISYSETYYDINKNIVGIYLNTNNNSFQVDIFVKSSGNYFIKNQIFDTKKFPYSKKKSSIFPLNISNKIVIKNIKQNKISKIKINRHGTNIIIASKNYYKQYISNNISMPSLSPTGVYFTLLKKNFYSLRFYNFDKNSFEIIPKPKYPGHFYNPYFWNNFLIYTGIIKENNYFVYNVYFSNLKTKKIFAKTINYSKYPDLKFFKYDGNKTGKYFGLLYDTADFIIVFNMKYFPFTVTQSKIDNKDFLGFTSLKFKNIVEIKSFCFSPFEENKMLIVAREKNKYFYGIYETLLKKNIKIKHIDGFVIFKNIVILVLGLMLLIFSNILYKYRGK